MQWFAKPLPVEQVAQFKLRRSQSGLGPVFGHAGYLINLAAPPSTNRENSMQSLIQEVQRAAELDLPFLVLHPGAHLGAGEANGLARCAESLDEVFQETKRSPVRIALENTAGQGTCLGAELRHLADIYQKISQPQRLGLCVDTAHLFAAGYDIRTRKSWDRTIGEVERLIGCKEILAFHLNDSKTDLGSRIDRHAHIGQGKIGRDAFRFIVNDDRFTSHSGCLETPKSDDLHEDIENLRVLRSLVAPARKFSGIHRKENNCGQLRSRSSMFALVTRTKRRSNSSR
jgi:deoxyribonuclease-4